MLNLLIVITDLSEAANLQLQLALAPLLLTMLVEHDEAPTQ